MFKSKKGAAHPPRNNKANKKLINIIWEYSAKKNKAKDIEEYSTLKPETNSDSPSVKSKGALLVSAKQEMKNIKAAGSNGNINQIVWLCTWIIVVKFNEPAQRIAEIIIKPIETS